MKTIWANANINYASNYCVMSLFKYHEEENRPKLYVELSDFNELESEILELKRQIKILRSEFPYELLIECYETLNKINKEFQCGNSIHETWTIELTKEMLEKLKAFVNERVK